MDKVIDGVNVSECKYYDDGTCYNKDIMSFSCENTDCIYKQLQRAKAEIEELKKTSKNNETAYHIELGTYNMECGNLLEENKELIENNLNLSKENEQLKANKGRCAFKCLDNTFCPEADKKITELELSRNSYKVNFETAKKYREKAEQALQEIREELEEDITCESRECGCDDYGECLNCLKETILTKINEVIGAE